MYEIKVLSDVEFDELPYPEMSTSLGVADPRTRTAFVRDTGIPALTLFNAAHELEHLRDGHDGVYADHYRNGVYYKNIGDMFRQIAPMALNAIPGVGTGLSLAATAGNAAFDVNRANKDKKAQSNEMASFSQQPSAPQATSPLESFSKPPAHSIVPGGPSAGNRGSFQGGNMQNSISGMMGGGTAIERARGFFSTRPSQGGF